MVDVARELRRVLKPDGWLWWNIGDKANASGGAGGDWKRPGNSRTWSASSQGPGWFRDTSYEPQTFLDVPGATVRAFTLAGWRLRLPIVWEKAGSREPASMRHLGRPLWSHEMIYLLSPTRQRGRFYPSALTETGSVWHFPPGGSGDPHLAPFPDELARRCILPTTLPGDLVLDPFGGSHTVHRVAEALGRRAISVELYHDRDELRHGA